MLLILFISLFSWTSSEGDVSHRIVNGTDVLPGDYPYVVSVRYFDMHECGGSIIGKKWVLTAAHCVYPSNIKDLRVLYGTIYLQNGRRPEKNTVDVINAFRHENYIASDGYDNDIGLLELRNSIIFSQFVSPVQLPIYHARTPSWASAVLLGWGYPETDGDVMDILQKVEILVFDEKSCAEAHGGLVNPLVHVCAGLIEGGKGQCSGDSGGPLTVNNVQYGIVSWSVKPCTIKGYPGVFTRVSTYRSWIRGKTGI